MGILFGKSGHEELEYKVLYKVGIATPPYEIRLYEAFYVISCRLESNRHNDAVRIAFN